MAKVVRSILRVDLGNLSSPISEGISTVVTTQVMEGQKASSKMLLTRMSLDNFSLEADSATMSRPKAGILPGHHSGSQSGHSELCRCHDSLLNCAIREKPASRAHN